MLPVIVKGRGKMVADVKELDRALSLLDWVLTQLPWTKVKDDEHWTQKAIVVETLLHEAQPFIAWEQVEQLLLAL
jgi:hypothetical protein